MPNGGASDQITLVTGTIGDFSAGQRIRVAMNFSGHGDRWGTVESAVGTTITTVDNIVTGANQGSDTGTARIYLASSPYWGTAASATRDRTIDGSNVTEDTGAAKASLMLYGAGIVVSKDNTALTYRYWDSDGVTHWMLDTGFDNDDTSTWPGGAGTDESVWRFLFAHNALRKAYVSTDYNLPTSGYMIVEDEVLYYIQSSYTKFGQVTGATPNVTGYLTIIPTYYTVCAAQAAAASTLYNAWISGHAVGEGFDSALILAGMLVEVTAREATEQGFRMPGVIQ